VVPLPQDASEPGLNAAAAAGRCWALARDAGALLVLFGDLPLLRPADVRHVFAVPAPVVLAPDRHETGTNALLLRFGKHRGATERFAFQFGAGSAGRHGAEARRLGLPFETVSTPGTALDLDTPEDWQAVLACATARSDDGADALVAELAGVERSRPGAEGDRR
jgi:2-phospho-L-lactate guanylyltransferase